MIGYCPHCGQACSLLLVNGKGYCPDHGYVWVDWNPRKKGNPRNDISASQSG